MFDFVNNNNNNNYNNNNFTKLCSHALQELLLCLIQENVYKFKQTNYDFNLDLARDEDFSLQEVDYFRF